MLLTEPVEVIEIPLCVEYLRTRESPSREIPKKSKMERHAAGLFVADQIPVFGIAKTMQREIAHVHSGNDHSVHVVLPPADCMQFSSVVWCLCDNFASEVSRLVGASVMISRVHLLWRFFRLARGLIFRRNIF